MEILSNESHADIVSWLSHGKGFMIYQKKRFAAEVLPNYFKQAKFTSFTRKLNRWNFARITRGPETGAYYHEYFQRGNLRLCMQMCCQNAKNLAAMKEHESIPATMDDAMSKLKLTQQQVDMNASNEALFQSFGTGGGMSQLFPGHLANQGGQLSQFAADNMFKLRQLEQQQQDLLMRHQQQQPQTDMTHVNQLATMSMSRSQQQNMLSPLGTSTPASASHPDAFTASMIQRSNASAYLAMIMTQEKLNTRMGALGGINNISPMDVQRQQANIMQAQQQQLDQYSQQRLFQQAALQQQQLQQQQQVSQQQLNQQQQLLQLQQIQQIQFQQQQFQQQAQCFDGNPNLLSMLQNNTRDESPPSEGGKPNKRTSSAA